MKPAQPLRHLGWPSQRFYWAMLDTSDFPRAPIGGGLSARRLGYVFENFLPGLQIEQVHAVYRRMPNSGQVLACGIPAAELELLSDDTVTLTPESLPAFLPQSVDAASLNVLTGRFLPAVVRRLHRSGIVQAGVILAACVALLVLGLERRTIGIREHTASVLDARASMLEQVLGVEVGTAGGQPPELRLTAEARRLEQTRETGDAVSELTDCSSILEALLGHWPAEVRARAESVSITDSAVTVRAIMVSMADAQRFADAFAAVPGWRLKQPRSEARRDDVVVTMRLEAQQGKP